MENFKINHYEQKNNSEEFQSFSLEYLNAESEFSRESRKEIEAQHENSKKEALNDALEVYSKIEKESERESSNFFEQKNETQENVVFFGDYGANFAIYGEKDGFSLRENLNRTPEELASEIEQIKSTPNIVPFQQKAKNFANAIFGRIPA